MRRTRVDGLKFQSDFVAAIEKSDIPAYVMRLYLPGAAQANVRNLADYVIFSKSAIIVEVKETKKSSFSLNTFQQKEEVDKFKSVFLTLARNNGELPSYRLAILIHFITENVYSLYYLDTGDYLILHPNDENSISFSALPEAIKFLLSN